MRSRRQWPGRVTLGYIGVLSAAFILAMIAGWSSLAEGMEGSAYDWMFRLQPPAPVHATSIVLAFDERTMGQTGGMRNFRQTLTETLRRLQKDRPAVVAIDAVLSDAVDPLTDAALEQALANTPNVILGSDVAGANRWEDPQPVFR